MQRAVELQIIRCAFCYAHAARGFDRMQRLAFAYCGVGDFLQPGRFLCDLQRLNGASFSSCVYSILRFIAEKVRGRLIAPTRNAKQREGVGWNFLRGRVGGSAVS
jgi:hypothetical protein